MKKVWNMNTDFGIFKSFLIEQIPFMDNLSSKEWDRLCSKYEKRLDLGLEYGINPHSFIDMAICSQCSDSKIASENLHRLIALNNLIENIQSHDLIKPYSLGLIKKIKGVFDIVSNPTEKDTPFKNTLNELVFLDSILRNNLIGNIVIEERLPNGKKCDYVITDKDNGKRTGFEIETLQFLDVSLSNTTEQIREYLENRAEKKWNKKTENLKEIPNLSDLYIVLFVEIHPEMGNVDFPQTFSKNLIVQSTQFFNSEPYNFDMTETWRYIKSLKKDDPDFFISKS